MSVKNHENIDIKMPKILQPKKRQDVVVNWTIAPERRIPAGWAAFERALGSMKNTHLTAVVLLAAGWIMLSAREILVFLSESLNTMQSVSSKKVNYDEQVTRKPQKRVCR
jgi:hypothetical protein